jgi:alginate O-acetyltransferase complex protein AlgI
MNRWASSRNRQRHLLRAPRARSRAPLVLYVGVAVHLYWLYLLFSGYCDVSAGFARLLGYRQAENFDKPWLSTSLRDFWRRWHLTLSFILRDYVYIALGGNRRHVPLNIMRHLLRVRRLALADGARSACGASRWACWSP